MEPNTDMVQDCGPSAETAESPPDRGEESAESRADGRIVSLFWERDERAVSACAARYGSYLTAVALNILPTPEDAEECVSDAYLRAWNSIPPHRPAILRLYLAKITRSAALDRFRKMNAQKRKCAPFGLALDELSEIVSGEPGPEDAAENGRLREAIESWLRTLSPDGRAIFVSRYFYGDDLKTIAKNLGCSDARVKSALFRARQGLRAHLEKEGFDL